MRNTKMRKTKTAELDEPNDERRATIDEDLFEACGILRTFLLLFVLLSFN